MAQLGWIDFSPSHRNRVGSVLDLLRPEGMVDELGVGTIRDALANNMFPGISTIQTRAKYFFIIPYILYEYHSLNPVKRRDRKPSKFLEKREYEIMWQLAEQYNYVEGNGVIGITKRKPNKIVRRPSAIYWNGLFTFQFINTRGLSMDVFLNQAAIPTMESLLSATQQGDDGNTDDADAEYEDMFRIRVARKPDWSENLTLDLQKDEAEFFADRITSIAKNKLIAELLSNVDLWQIFIDADNFMQFAKAAMILQLNPSLKAMLILAHDFSELMYGAHLAYNCQLHHKVFNNDFFDKDWNNWLENIEFSMLGHKNFNPNILFEYLFTTRDGTKKFVCEWWHHTQNGFSDLNIRDNLIQQQEANVKQNKARLRWNKTDDVKENKWLGLQHFDYRFNQVRTILKDIKTGLHN